MDKTDLIETTATPIVTALCNIVMDSLSCSQKLETHSQELLGGVTRLIDTAKKMSFESERGEGHLLLPEIIKGVRTVTDNMNQLLPSFKAFMKSPENVTQQDNFVKATQEFAESLCSLVNLVNECSQIRMFKLLKRAVLYLAEMERLIKAPPDQRTHLSKVTQSCEEINTRLIAVTTNALNYSKNEQKKELLNKGLDKLEEASPHLIDMAKRIPSNLQDSNFKNRALQFSFVVASGFQDIMSAMMLTEPTPFQLIWDTLLYVNVLIKASKELEIGSRSFYEAVMENASPEELDDFHLLTRELAQTLVNNLSDMMSREPSAVKRAFFEQMIWDLEDKLTELDEAALSAFQGSPLAGQMLEKFYNHAVSVTHKLFTGPEEDKQADMPLLHTTALTTLPDRVVLQPAHKQDKDTFLSDAQSAANIAADVGKVVDRLILDARLHDKKAMLDVLLEKKIILQNRANTVLVSAKTLSSQPTLLNEQALSVEQEKLNQVIGEVRQLEAENSSGLSLSSIDTNISGDDIDTSFL